METKYNLTLVILSVFVATFASYVALNLAHNVFQTKGRVHALWLACGAFAMGIGIWSMHFIGMLAFEMPGMEMAYDIPLMVLSVVVAIAASALALFIVSRNNVSATSILAGGVAMAGAISGMHYIGMYSMRMDATIVWNFYLVALSIVIALAASFAALMISIRLRNSSDQFFKLGLSAVLMGVAISGMHYTGMLAANFIHLDHAEIGSKDLLVSSGLTVAVFSATLSILVLALAGSIGHRIWTQRRSRSEENLMKSEERFQALIEAVKDYAIFMLDPNGNITTWNSGAERIMGYSAREAIGQHISVFYPDQKSGEAITSDALEKARATGHFEGEVPHVRPDGSLFWANIVISPLSSGDGFSKVVRDVTDLRNADARLRKLNEELEIKFADRTRELQKSERQLRMITNSLPVLIGQLDTNERFLFVNDALATWFGHTNETMTGCTFESVLGERYPDNKPFIDKTLAGHIISYERYSQSGNRMAVLNITFVPEFDVAGKVVGFLIVANDVSKYKEIETELKKAKIAAEVASETKSAFLANMSHEIRTPLGAILGFSELIMTQKMSPSEREKGIEIIKRNGLLLSNIINDILDLSKVEAGKLEVDKIDVALEEILSEIGSLLNLEATGKGIKLTVTSEGIIPQKIKTDPLRLRQILLNIVGNAIKFTSSGSVDVKVKMNSQSPSQLDFIVKDTGEGIAPENVAKLFTAFTQADVSTTRRFGGTGLGLVLSKKLAKALGGDVVLTASELGKGSTFTVSIQVGAAEKVLFSNSESSPSKIIPLPTFGSSEELAQLNILVIDDSADNQALVKNLLRLAGAQVETASNGREGVQKAMSGDFSLVLMDLQMPEMDGYEATRVLRQRGFQKPIIALTAHAMKEERRRCLENGFNDHLTKPVDRELLLRTLSDYAI